MSGSHSGTPTCRVIVDLRGTPWATDAEEAKRRILTHPGAVALDVATARRRAVVHDESGRSLAEMFNRLLRWQRDEPTGTASATGARRSHFLG